jgi:molybdate transport system substrate-binding protein
LSSIAATNGSVAGAAEVKVLTSVALTSALNELVPKFEQATGNKLNIGYSLIADIRKRILDGETADVIILSRPVMDELDKQDKFAPGSITDVAGTPVPAPRPPTSDGAEVKRVAPALKASHAKYMSRHGFEATPRGC